MIFLIFLPFTVNALDGTNSNSANISFVNGTCQCPNATVGDTDVINGVMYTAVDNSTIAGQVANGNINLCTTLVTNMSSLFRDNSSFNSDIRFWDTVAVNDMSGMFRDATTFNGDISNWNTSAVTNMEGMFRDAAAFNQYLRGWCVTNISSEPSNFATGSSALTSSNKPLWGNCNQVINNGLLRLEELELRGKRY